MKTNISYIRTCIIILIFILYIIISCSPSEILLLDNTSDTKIITEDIINLQKDQNPSEDPNTYESSLNISSKIKSWCY